MSSDHGVLFFSVEQCIHGYHIYRYKYMESAAATPEMAATSEMAAGTMVETASYAFGLLYYYFVICVALVSKLTVTGSRAGEPLDSGVRGGEVLGQNLRLWSKRGVYYRASTVLYIDVLVQFTYIPRRLFS